MTTPPAILSPPPQGRPRPPAEVEEVEDEEEGVVIYAADRTHPASIPPPMVDVPPPVYMPAPFYTFAVEEPPPPYMLAKDLEAASLAKVREAHRMRWSRTAATVAIIVTAAAVIAGGLYGYHQGI